MKNNKIKIILSAIILSAMVGFSGTVYATNASLYISPASLTKDVGSVFNTSVGVNTSGNKVCAVEGTLVFNNLSCQNITVASGLMTQSTPSCSSPYFLIGIPNCSTTDKILLTASVKAGSTGVASINVSGVDIIGEGASVGSSVTNGNYTINDISTTPTSTFTPSTSTPKSTTQTTTSTEQTTIDTETSTDPDIETSENNLIANLGATGATSSFAYAFWVLLTLNVIYALAHGTYYIKKKRKQK